MIPEQSVVATMHPPANGKLLLRQVLTRFLLLAPQHLGKTHLTQRLIQVMGAHPEQTTRQFRNHEI